MIRTDSELATAVARMREAGTDLSGWELKTAAGGFPKSAAETVSAFANTCGGALVLGITEDGFHSVPGLDVKVMLTQCAQVCRGQVEPPIQAQIEVLEYEGNPVVVANVPELPVDEKPCYVRRLGRAEGSYVRTGDGDHRMSAYEIDRMVEAARGSARNDVAIVAEATPDDLDPTLVLRWLSRVRGSSVGPVGQMSNTSILVNRRVLGNDPDGVMRPTLAGLLALGRFPQRFCPRLDVLCTIHRGGDRPPVEKCVDGSIPQMVAGAVGVVVRAVGDGSPDCPPKVLREVVANALVHRDYSVAAQGRPVRVDVWPDRVEVSNPGGPYASPAPGVSAGAVGRVARNQFLTRILEDVPSVAGDVVDGRILEGRGGGYDIIRRELAGAQLEGPRFWCTPGEFRVVLPRG